VAIHSVLQIRLISWLSPTTAALKQRGNRAMAIVSFREDELPDMTEEREYFRYNDA
jgi:hypothetical protein